MIQPNGAKLWRFDYRFGGKRKTLAFGKFPDIPLADARQKRTDARASLTATKDPATLGNVAPDGQFESIARRWLTTQRVSLSQFTYARKLRRMETSVVPRIGQRSIVEIDETEMLKVLRPIEARGSAYTARVIAAYCGEVFLYAKAEGRCDRNPCRDLSKALQKPPRVKHDGTIYPSELPLMLSKVHRYDGEPMLGLACCGRSRRLSGPTRHDLRSGASSRAWTRASLFGEYVRRR